MKRIICLQLFVLSLCLLAACGQQSVEESAAEPETAPSPPILVGMVVDTDNVNLRIAPDEESRIIDNLVAGSLLEVTEEEPLNGWYQVMLRGDAAYIYQDFLYVSQRHAGDEVVLGTVLKDQDQVELRMEPSTNAVIIEKAVRYQQFLVLDPGDGSGWIKVDYKGEPAWLPEGCLKLETVCIDDLLL
ncbi:MAG: SH3 domain-containing protein [Firmicutes bacterium]|nr:SH3 domain-containing protein [Bacillota bacterium]